MILCVRNKTYLCRVAVSSVAFILPFITYFVSYAPPALADFEAANWSRYRHVIPIPNVSGQAGLALESEILEKCRPDYADLTLVRNDKVITPFTLYFGDYMEPEPFPVQILRTVNTSDNGTEIWVDKGGKLLTTGLALKIDGAEFTRRVELKGSDNNRDFYVLRMDGLIIKQTAPLPIQALDIRHVANNFQYLYIHIPADGGPPLNVSSVLCYPPFDDSPALQTQEMKTLEKRRDGNSGASVIIADFGEKRLPVRRIQLMCREGNFVKRVLIWGSQFSLAGEWQLLHENVAFHRQREDAFKEGLSFNFKPWIGRYIKIELRDGTKAPVLPDRVKAQGAGPTLVFDYHPNSEYRLYYGSLHVSPAAASALPTATNPRLSQLMMFNLSDELKPPAPKIAAPKTEPAPSLGPGVQVGKILGVVMLLFGLLLLFSIMLKARSLRKDRHKTEYTVHGR